MRLFKLLAALRKAAKLLKKAVDYVTRGARMIETAREVKEGAKEALRRDTPPKTPPPVYDPSDPRQVAVQLVRALQRAVDIVQEARQAGGEEVSPTASSRPEEPDVHQVTLFELIPGGAEA